jgi:muramoyltetrapeptide carboxypeptidase
VIRPPALRPGDVVGIVSPSALTAAHVPRRLSRGLAELERRGFRVRMAEHAADAAARRADKVADLHAMFASEDVRAVVCTTGGASSHQLLEDLDFELIAANPKVFVGYSDITALHAAIWARTRLAVVQGPALLQQWAEFGGIDDYAWSSWERTLMRAEPAGEIAASAHWWYERLEYDKEDDRPRRREPNRGPRVVRAGAAEGPLVATNLCTLLLLVGTEWWPDLDGTILCLETAEEEQAWWIERSLHHLRHLGVWSKVAGVAFARCHPDSQLPEARLDEILLDATRGAAVPIAAGFDFGHTDPLACMPWGVRARLDGARLELLEAAVV